MRYDKYNKIPTMNTVTLNDQASTNIEITENFEYVDGKFVHCDHELVLPKFKNNEKIIGAIETYHYKVLVSNKNNVYESVDAGEDVYGFVKIGNFVKWFFINHGTAYVICEDDDGEIFTMFYAGNVNFKKMKICECVDCAYPSDKNELSFCTIGDMLVYCDNCYKIKGLAKCDNENKIEYICKKANMTVSDFIEENSENLEKYKIDMPESITVCGEVDNDDSDDE